VRERERGRERKGKETERNSFFVLSFERERVERTKPNTTTSTIFSPFRARFPSILFYVVLSLGPIFCECERDSVLFLPAAGAGKLFPKIKTKIFPFSLSPDFDSFSV
jgi:hypothetical protein